MQRGRAFMDAGWMGRLPARASATWLVLYFHADVDTLVCWPSLMTIGRLTGLDKGNVTRALNELEGCGLVSRKRGGGKVRTVYTIHPPVAPAQQVGQVRQRDRTGGTGATGAGAPAQPELVRQRNQNSFKGTYIRKQQQVTPAAVQRDEGGTGQADRSAAEAPTGATNAGGGTPGPQERKGNKGNGGQLEREADSRLCEGIIDAMNDTDLEQLKVRVLADDDLLRKRWADKNPRGKCALRTLMVNRLVEDRAANRTPAGSPEAPAPLA